MNQQSEKKTGFRFSIRIKITLMFATIIVLMLIPVFLLMRYSNNYINRYDEVLSNINKIDSILTETASQPQRILNYCITNENIKDSGESEKIAEMIQYISDIKYAIGTDEKYAKNLEQADTVEQLLNNYLQNYREGIGLCGDRFSLAGDSQFYTMNDISSYISDNCSSLFGLEMDRTADIQKHVAANYKQMLAKTCVMLLVIVLIAVVLVVLLQRIVTTPIRLLSKKVAVIADKDLTDTVVEVRTKDEIGDLAYVFNVMCNNLKDVLEKASAVSNDVEHSFHEVTQNVEDTAQGSTNTTQNVAQMLEKIQKQNDESRVVMEHIEDIDGISDKIYKNTERIMRSAQKSIEGADQGVQKLKDYTEQLASLNHTMQEITQIVNDLGSSTQQMNNIVDTISDKSDETNLLSLNASIEAARAGEAGKGFAVVAQQIQSLAENSKKSVEEIGELISTVQNRTSNVITEMQDGMKQLERGNVIADETGKSFSTIETSIDEVNSNIEEIVVNVKALTKIVADTSGNMETIDSAMSDTADVTQKISDTVNTETANLQELTATMTGLLNTTTELKDMLAQFKL